METKVFTNIDDLLEFLRSSVGETPESATDVPSNNHNTETDNGNSESTDSCIVLVNKDYKKQFYGDDLVRFRRDTEFQPAMSYDDTVWQSALSVEVLNQKTKYFYIGSDKKVHTLGSYNNLTEAQNAFVEVRDAEWLFNMEELLDLAESLLEIKF